MLDQIVPAIAAGRLVVFGETTPKGLARLMQIRPSLRGLFETIAIEPLPANETLALAEDVLAGMAKTMSPKAPKWPSTRRANTFPAAVCRALRCSCSS
jgi:hypothetical protein